MTTTTATAAGRPRREPLTGSRTVAATVEPEPRNRGATTGWLAAGGALDPPDGNAGKVGITADEGVFEAVGVGVGVGVGVADGVTDAETVGVGGGFGEWVGGVGASDSTGGGMNVRVGLGVGGAASTEIDPRPDRIPSVAVTVADVVAT
jgi:hypothetical protein